MPRKVRSSLYARVAAALLDSSSAECIFETRDEATNNIRKFTAHRKLLAAVSPVFARMFNRNPKNESAAIKIDDASPEDFRAFLGYIYKGKVTLFANNVDPIFHLAHKYDIGDLVISCSTFMQDNLNVENVIRYLDVALRFDQENLKSECFELISMRSEDILNSEKFIQCDKNLLKCVLELSQFSCEDHIVFDQCIEWAKQKCREKKIDECLKSLRAELGDCFDMIRYKNMEFEQFLRRFEVYKAMLTRKEMAIICTEFMNDRDCEEENLVENQAYPVRSYNLQPKNEFDFEMPYTDNKLLITDEYLHHEFKNNTGTSLLLNGITISQPFVDQINLKFDFTLEILKDQKQIFNIWSYTFDSQYRRIPFHKPIYIERDQDYTISIKFYNKAITKLPFDIKIRSHAPTFTNGNSDAPSNCDDDLHIISALHVQVCDKESLNQLSSEHLTAYRHE